MNKLTPQKEPLCGRDADQHSHGRSGSGRLEGQRFIMRSQTFVANILASRRRNILVCWVILEYLVFINYHEVAMNISRIFGEQDSTEQIKQIF